MRARDAEIDGFGERRFHRRLREQSQRVAGDGAVVMGAADGILERAMLGHQPDGVLEIGVTGFAALQGAAPELALGVAFQLVDDALDYGGKAARLGKNVGDDFREGKITLPVVLAFRRGSDAERAFWQRTLEHGDMAEGDLDHAIGLMAKHRAIEDTVSRARHYGAIAKDALALFPAAPMKQALEDAVEFAIERTN